MDSRITVGILGFGLIGRTHAQALAQVDDATLRAVVSRRGKPADEALEPYLHDAQWYESPDTLYACGAPDVVAICSPPGMHAAQARKALEHDAHVLIEKPPASDVAELKQLVELAHRRERVLTVVSQQRMEPHLAHVAAVISQGAFGRPRLGELRLHWHRPQRYYDDGPWRSTDAHGGSLANQGRHAADLLTWFLGPAAIVTAQTATLAHDISVEDTTVASVQFRSGALGSIVTSTATPPGEPTEIRLFFERGAITIRDTQVVEWDAPGEAPPPPATGNAASGASDPSAIGSVGHRKQWDDLVTAIRTKTPPAIDAAESLHTLALIEAIYHSANKGTAVAVDEEVA